jgi:HK97 family phage major capsid protein
MTKFTIVAEEGAITAAENEPTFAQVAVTLYNFKKLIKVSEELLEDENSNLEAFLTNAIGRALADTENYYALIGAGSTEPQGAFVGGTAGLTLDSATAIGAGEIPELMGKLGTPYHNGAAMVMDPATWFYLKGLTGNQFIFTDGIARLSGTVDGPTLDGFPVVLNSNVANIAASAKSLLFGNFDYMGFVTNRGVRVRRLVELYAGNGQVGILANYRFGCAVLQAEAFQYATHPTG